MNDQAPGPSGGTNHDRLNGWKEIAAHFGKSVRSVQRWERELGLPVHRLHTPGGEIVFARRSELEQWENGVRLARTEHTERDGANGEQRNGAVAAREGKEVEGAEEVEGKTRALAGVNGVEEVATNTAHSDAHVISARHSRPWVQWAVAASVMVAAIALWAGLQNGLLASRVPGLRKIFAGRSKSKPSFARVENGVLQIFDVRGERLWEHRFPFALADVYQADRIYQPAYLAVEDVDGDGEREVLIVTLGSNVYGARLICFDADGTVRFDVQPSREVRYGGTVYRPPFFVRGFVLTSEPDGTKTIWALAVHNFQFPSLVWKLDAHGRSLAEYWSNGHITALQEGRYYGRRVMLVGAMNNEFIATTLATLDYDHPEGFAPAENPKYRCEDCPPGEPLAFDVFPRTEMSREFQTPPVLSQIRTRPDGGATIAILQTTQALKSQPGYFGADIWYTLNERLQLTEAETGAMYRLVHSEPELMRRLKHKFGPKCEEQIFPVLTWNGTKFVELARPKTSRNSSVLSANIRRRH